MERLTTNKDAADMGMYELAHNSCYCGEDGNARYRDYESDIDAREFARGLMVKYGIWQSFEDTNTIANTEMIDDDVFDETMINYLMECPENIEGLIALFYRNLWAMADLRERLKAYEDAEEHTGGWIPFMKEFIEKLISRLEEEAFSVQIKRGEKEPSTHDAMMEKFSVLDIKKIVNELAEEFATDINVVSRNG